MLNKPNPDIQLIKDKIIKIEDRVAKAEKYQDECEELHKKLEEPSKRNDDAMRNNTESNILVAKSLNSLNLTVVDLSVRIDSHEPVVKEWMNIGTAWNVNKKLLLGAGIAAGSVTSIVAAYNYFF